MWPIGIVTLKIEENNLLIHNGLGENIYYVAISDNNNAFTYFEPEDINSFIRPREVKKISIDKLRIGLGISKEIYVYWWRSSEIESINLDKISIIQ